MVERFGDLQERFVDMLQGPSSYSFGGCVCFCSREILDGCINSKCKMKTSPIRRPDVCFTVTVNI